MDKQVIKKIITERHCEVQERRLVPRPHLEMVLDRLIRCCFLGERVASLSECEYICSDKD